MQIVMARPLPGREGAPARHELTGAGRPVPGALDLGSAYAGSRALVTGSAGFIGGRLATCLADSGAEVTVVDVLPRPAEFGTVALAWEQLDIASEKFGRLLARRPAFDYLFHLAGRAYAADSVDAPAADFEANLSITLRILELLRASRPATHLVFASSAAVYGEPAKLPIEEGDPTVPVSPYGVAKLAAERYVAVYARLYGLAATSLRLFSVYGPRQRKQVVYDLLMRLRESPRELVVRGDGTQARDLVYVDDAATAFMVAGARGSREGAVYNVATGTATSIAELARLIVETQGLTAALRFTGAGRPGNPERWVGSSAALAALGWAPRQALRAGLEETARWLDATADPVAAAAPA